MSKLQLLIIGWLAITTLHAQELRKITGGVMPSKSEIQRDILLEVIQEKQEEVFDRLFANVIVNYFKQSKRTESLTNFPTYYALYSIMKDLTEEKRNRLYLAKF